MLICLYYLIVLFLILPVAYQKEDIEYDIRNENYKVAKYAAVILFIICLLYGFISNTLMAIVLFCRRRDNYYSYSFILIASQMIICNFTAFLPQTIVVLPEILQTKNSSYGKLLTPLLTSFAYYLL